MFLANAYKGIRIIIVGEIIGAIGTILFNLPAMLISLIGNGSGDFEIADYAIVSLLSGFGEDFYSAVSIVNWIIVLIGAIIASKDEKKFKEAAIIVVISMISTLVPVFIDVQAELVVAIVAGLFDLWAIIAVIQGCINVADKYEDYKTSDRGSFTLKFVLAVFTVAILMGLTFSFFAARSSLVLIGVIVVSISEIVEIAMYLIYINYLIKVKKMMKTQGLEKQQRFENLSQASKQLQEQ